MRMMRPVRGNLGRLCGRLGPLTAGLGEVSGGRGVRLVQPVRRNLGRRRLGPLAAARALVHRQLGLQEVHAEDGRDLGAPGRKGLAIGPQALFSQGDSFRFPSRFP